MNLAQYQAFKNDESDGNTAVRAETTIPDANLSGNSRLIPNLNG